MTNYECLKHRVLTAADDGIYEWALDEIERLREVLQRIAKSPDNDPNHLRWLAADALKEKQ